MPAAEAAAVADALRAAGYSHLHRDFPFYPEKSAAPEKAPAELVAFWADPPDQSTAAVAVRWLRNGQDRQAYLAPLREALWVPYAIVASAESCEVWETLPPLSDTGPARPSLLNANVAYGDLRSLLAASEHRLGRDAVAARKRRWRQMALYEADAEPNAFMRWAFQPTRARLTRILDGVFRDARKVLGPQGDLSAGHVRWLLRLIGTRAAWDKRWLDPGSRTSAAEVLAAAMRYPTETPQITDVSVSAAAELAAIVADRLGSVDLGAADGGLLSQLLQEGGIPRTLQQEWELFPTPQHIAWRMVASLPFEAMSADRRRVWDGTCGSGTILVAALDRLRGLVPDLDLPELRRYLVGAIGGNDMAPALADATRIALDQALGAPAASDWQVTVGDVAESAAPPPGIAPAIIVGNPPFKARGRTPNLAITVVQRYVNSLPPGGLLSVVVPRSLLASDAARALRKQLLAWFELYEILELPKRAFRGTDQETAVLSGRRLLASERPESAVTWRRVPRNGGEDSIDTVMQTDWAQDERAAIRPPLALRLEAHLAARRRLSRYVPDSHRTQGITPGKLARDAVLQYEEPGAVPYLAGREDMLPFSLPWHLHPRWLRYDPSKLQWPRRQRAWIFRARKVVVSRHATWGSAWRVRAAIDEAGLFLSDQFVALVPLPPLTPEYVAALFNSALANCWLKLVNPAFSTNLEHMLQLPVPDDPLGAKIKRIDEIARRLQWARKQDGATSHETVAALTLELDEAIYDAYSVPTDLQVDIAEHFRWLGDKRDGFDEPMVAVPRQSGVTRVFTERDAQRMRQLFTKREEEPLSRDEEVELDRLVGVWQKAHIRAANMPDSYQREGELSPAVEAPLPT